jgi:hypothetical protein
METIVDILTEDATKLLLDLCRTGKLYEIERWIDAGRSLRTRRSRRKHRSKSLSSRDSIVWSTC